METTSTKDRLGPAGASDDEEDLETMGEVDAVDCSVEYSLEPEAAAALGAIDELELG
jgi:hypothetical protein